MKKLTSFVLLTFIFLQNISWSATNFQIMEDPDVDVALRVKAIDEAKESVRVVAFTFNVSTRYGRAIWEALKRAANRGVKVELMFNKILTIALKGEVNEVKEGAIKHKNITADIGNFGERIRSGLSVDDFVHEKLTLIDEKTLDAKVFTGGLNYDGFSATFYDDGFMIKNADPDKPDELFKEIGDGFDRTWAVMMAGQKKNKEANSTDHLPAISQEESFKDLLNTPEKKEEFERLAAQKNLIRSENTEFVHSDLFHQLGNANAYTRYVNRDAIVDHIGEKLKELLVDAESVVMTAYTYGPRKNVEEGLQAMLNKGGRLEYITNGIGGHSAFPNSFPAFLSYKNLIDFKAKLNKDAQDRVTLRTLEKQTPDGDSPRYGYMHNKLVLIKHKDKVYTVIGSENFTHTNRTNQEANFIVEEPVGNSPFYDAVNDKLNLHRKEFLPTSWEDVYAKFKLRKLKAICPLIFNFVRYTY